MKNFMLLLSVFSLGTLVQANLYAGNSVTAEQSARDAGVNKQTSSVLIISEPNGDLTLRDVLALVLMHNPQLKAYSLEISAAEARQLQAGLWPNPELITEVQDIGGTGVQRGFDAAETTIQLSQLIELGNKAQKRRAVASLEKELAGWDYQTKRLEVLTDAGKAFIELLAVQEKTKLLAGLVDVSRNIFTSVSQRVDSGKDSPLEKSKASVALAAVQIEHKQALRQLENARKLLALFWDSPQPEFTQAVGQLETTPDIPDKIELQKILLQNPRLARWQNEIDRSKAALDLAKSKALPDITLSAGLRRYNEFDDNAFVFGIAIPLPLSDRNQGGKREAAFNLSKSYQQQKTARIDSLYQFNRIFTELTVSLSKIKDYQASILPAVKEVLDASQTAYNAGKLDYLNVLDAQRTYFLSQTEYLNILVAYHKAKQELSGLIGQSLEVIKPLKEIKGDGL